jgi:dihydrofolate synthase/folylpolyglutamate synthase
MPLAMTYREALRRLASLEPHVIRPGLDRVASLLARLGDPQQAFPSVLVAGTNGKGSVVAFLGSILREAGYLPGIYTSPHLVRFEERIVIGRRPIPQSEVAALTAEVGAAAGEDIRRGGEPPTYFEATTALAFLHFRRAGVPIVLLEVGMGGRYDATNVVDPVACAITPVALDHTQWLGATLDAIARQKAGILRPGVPCVLAAQEPEALAAIQDEAVRAGAPLLTSGACEVELLARGAPGAHPASAGAAPATGSWPATATGPVAGSRPSTGSRPTDIPAPQSDPPVFSLATPSGGRYPRLSLALRGAHQVGNAVTAVLLAERLRGIGFGAIDAAAVARGLERAEWPGRLELIPGPCPGEPASPAVAGAASPDVAPPDVAPPDPAPPDLLLDGAHNPAGCRTLAAYLDEHASGRRVVMVFSAMRDKPAGEMLDILAPRAAAIFVTRLRVGRGEDLETLHRLAAARHPHAGAAPTTARAVDAARAAAGPGGLVLVCGSLYLVGEAKQALGRALIPGRRDETGGAARPRRHLR